MSSEQNVMIGGYGTDLCHTRSELHGILRKMTMAAHDNLLCVKIPRKWPENEYYPQGHNCGSIVGIRFHIGTFFFAGAQ